MCSSHCFSWYIQEAVKLKPNFSDAYLNLGNVYKVRYFLFFMLVRLYSCKGQDYGERRVLFMFPRP